LAFNCVKNMHRDLIQAMRDHNYAHTNIEKWFYRVRDSFATRAEAVGGNDYAFYNYPSLRAMSCSDRTARFLYIKSAGFNGIFRQRKILTTSAQGNVSEHIVNDTSIGDKGKERTKIFTDNYINRIAKCSQALNVFGSAYFSCRDFSKPMEYAYDYRKETNRNVVIYCDPPYDSVGNEYGVKYTDNDRKRLRNLAFLCAQAGVTVFINDNDTPKIRNFYGDKKVNAFNRNNKGKDIEVSINEIPVRYFLHTTVTGSKAETRNDLLLEVRLAC